MKKLTTKQKVLRELKKTKGNLFSFKKLAKKVGISENSLRCWLWCLQNRDYEVVINRPYNKIGMAQIVI